MNKIVYNDKIEQVKFSMSDVASELGITTSSLRYWCNELHFLTKRNKKGSRVFTKEDINVLIVSKHLLKEQLFTFQGARNELRRRGLSINHPTV